jgi:tetratricopeptide (TPR) repeat protein
VKGTIALAVALAVAAGAVVGYQEVGRQRQYRALIRRGDEALRGEEPSAAIEAYSGAIALRAESMLAYLRRGEAYRRRSPGEGDLSAAAHDFRKASQIDPSAPRPFEELGDVLYRLERYDRAVEAYDESLRLDDRSERVTYKLALARYRTGDVEAALAEVGQALRLNDRMAEAHYLRGLCLREQGHAPEAAKAFERAVSLSPALIPAREELVDLYRDLGRRADALEQLQLLAGLDRERVERHVAVGLAHVEARHWEAAVLSLGSVLERMPDDPQLYRTLGQVWLESAEARGEATDLNKAREALDRAAATADAPSDVLALAGRVALARGDLEAAERALERATTRFPLRPQALVLYATVAERQNHLENARRALVQYGALVADDPDLAGRAARIAALSLRLNDPRTAADWIARGLRHDPHNAALSSLELKMASARPKS